MKRILLAVSIALTILFTANAGSLNNGSWSPSGCGARPEAPNIDSNSVDTLNQSIVAVNAWQKQLQTYDECMIKEANADVAAISNAANAQQVQYREASTKINTELAAAKDKFGSGASPAGVGAGNPGLGSPGAGGQSY